MIAIPDFVSGAMEHWGLITYRETNLLFDERESSSQNQQRVASVVSHELAHQCKYTKASHSVNSHCVIFMLFLK